MADIDYDRLSEAVARALVAGGSGNSIAPRTGVGSRNAHNDEREWSRMMDSIKRAHTGFDKWNSILRKGQLQYVDVTQRLKELDDEIASIDTNLSAFDAAIARNALEEKKAALARAAASQNLSTAFANAASLVHKGADGVGKLGTSAAIASGQLVRNFLDSGNGIGAATDVMSAGIDMAGQASAAAGQAIGGVGNAMTNSSNKWVKGLGMATEALGPFMGAIGEKASAFLKFGVSVLGKEVEKTVKAFNDASSVGAVFAGGLSELRDTAYDAGLTLDQFSNVLQKHSSDLAAAGQGVSEGARKVGGAIKAGGVEMKTQLLNLGFSFEEQAGLVAETMKDMRSSGGPLRASNAQVAAETQKYAENLRTIAAITGEDGKKRMEDARNKANQLAFQQKLAGMDETQRRGVINAMGNMSEIQQKNFMDMVNFGSVINQEGATAAALSPGLNDSVKQFTESFKNGTLDEMTARRIQADNTGQIKQDMLDNVSIGLAGAAGVGGLVQSLSESMGTELQFRNKWTKEAIEAGTEGVQAQKTTQDEFTATVRDVEVQMQSFKLMLQKLINPLLGEYTRVLDESIKTIMAVIDEVIPNHKNAGSESGSWWSKHGREVLDYGGTAVGTTLGVLGGGIAGLGVGAVPAAVAGGYSGHQIGNAIADTLGLEPSDKGKADGGIASGPKRGFLEKLHGTELVIPLDNNGKIKSGTRGYSDLIDATSNQTVRINANDFDRNHGAESTLKSANLANSIIDAFNGTEQKLPVAAPKDFSESVTSMDKLMRNIQTSTPDLSSVTSSLNELSDKMVNSAISPLKDAIAALTNMIESKEKPSESADKATSQLTAEMIVALENLITTAKDQLEKQDEMLRAMQDTKDYTERLYNAMS